jgi:predicted MFS family arabinose efflux permease
VMAAGLIALSQAQGLWTYALAWLVIGLAAPIALTQAAMSALAQIAGADARRAMGTLLLFSGFSSAVFWPLTAWLEARLGWRETCLVFAGLHLLICCPLHALVIPTLTGRREARVAPGPQERMASRLPPAVSGSPWPWWRSLSRSAASCPGDCPSSSSRS